MRLTNIRLVSCQTGRRPGRVAGVIRTFAILPPLAAALVLTSAAIPAPSSAADASVPNWFVDGSWLVLVAGCMDHAWVACDVLRRPLHDVVSGVIVIRDPVTHAARPMWP